MTNAKIADLMSYSVQTVEVNAKIAEIIQRLRRIGHEGYPVIENGLVVGLLTLRDADKVLEYGIDTATVRDVMHSGNVCVRPNDSVSLLASLMIDNNWGQIPVVNNQQQIIGIVTRTDLIKYWAQQHTTVSGNNQQIDSKLLQSILGDATLNLIECIATHAQSKNIALYLVGGVVRDLQLKRPNLDIDFVVEGDAIAFAENIQTIYGGRLHTHKPFGTAKWSLDATTAQNLNLAFAAIPDHIDFASTRSELYEHPTALPTVYDSSIKLDLRRRDFTINTLAIQLSPVSSMWQMLDFYGGLADLEQKLIRVLHSLSFVDDPTRILRAVRFSERLSFTIEPRTVELIQSALPMLRRITGERIRNELELLLKEPAPSRGLLKLEALGALQNIHPDFTIKPEIQAVFDELTGDYPAWAENEILLRWHLVLANSGADNIVNIARRLLFSEKQSEDFQRTAYLIDAREKLAHPLTKPSEIDDLLKPASAETLVAVWVLSPDKTIRQHIEKYYDEWQRIKPTITGNDLRERGLKQGREYSIILKKLREHWLDGDITNADDEQLMLKRLITEVYHDSTR